MKGDGAREISTLKMKLMSLVAQGDHLNFTGILEKGFNW